MMRLTDQNLARRVRARLDRWDVQVDMSQGEPLAETDIGVFLEAVLDVSQKPDGALEKAVLFGHGLTSLGKTSEDLLAAWHLIEHHIYRSERSKKKPDRAIEDDLLAALNPSISPRKQMCMAAKFYGAGKQAKMPRACSRISSSMVIIYPM